jgi:trans-2,3-dihydro-3-hydroxyanthranilate isomerase
MNTLAYRHVDVFAARPLSGNGLTVFRLKTDLPAALLLAIAQEMRQFESIFLYPADGQHRYRARIFTMEEELGFAGHPVIGAAAVLHAEDFAGEEQVSLSLALPAKEVHVVSRRNDISCVAEMDQGEASFGARPDVALQAELLQILNLDSSDLLEGMPLEVVSTGVPYLIVPLKKNLAQARITRGGMEALLARVGAKFVYVLDVPAMEGRTWDNEGKVEDIATGSAAGPAGAYLARHGRILRDLPVVFHQGRFVGRPSRLGVTVDSDGMRVRVTGEVAFVGQGSITLPAL